MVFELQRADGMGDAFQRVGDAVGVVVHRIDAPLVAGADVVRALDAVEHRIAHIDVGRRHVDLGAQHHGAVGELAGFHAREQIEILRHRAVTVGTVPARLFQCAAILAHLLRREIVHIGQALVDELDREVVQGIEIIRGPAHRAVPLETEPAHVILDGLRVFLALLLRVGVVEAQVAGALVILREAEVQADRLGVADVQITVRLGREARGDAPVFAAGQIGFDDAADEVGDGGGGVAAHVCARKIQ